MTPSEEIQEAHRRLDDIARRIAEADQDGEEIEHLNAEALDRVLDLGRVLVAQTPPYLRKGRPGR